MKLYRTVNRKDIQNELQRLSNIVVNDPSPLLAREATKKMNWILEFIREEQCRGFKGKRSKKPSLSQLEEI